MFKVNNKNNRPTSMTSFAVFIVNFEHGSHIFLIFLFLTLNKKILTGTFLCEFSQNGRLLRQHVFCLSGLCDFENVFQCH